MVDWAELLAPVAMQLPFKLLIKLKDDNPDIYIKSPI
jgi:hypothetical protein